MQAYCSVFAECCRVGYIKTLSVRELYNIAYGHVIVKRGRKKVTLRNRSCNRTSVMLISDDDLLFI